MVLQIILPIVGAGAFAVAEIFQKIVLREKGVKSRHFAVASFLAAVLVMLPFLYFFGRVDSEAFLLKNLLILFGVVVFAIFANLLVFYALKWEKVTALEPVRLLEPLFVVVLAFAFLKSERDPKVLIPALVAGATLVLTHVKKHHISFNKYMVAGIFGSLFFATELLMTKFLLPYYSPISIYFARGLLVFVILGLFFRPNLRKELGVAERWMILGTGALWVGLRIIVYYGYVNWGVVFTTLMLMLAHVFVYFLAHFALKEKMNYRNLVATAVIIACVVYVNFV
jgi:drug/metabolite transporter (DMT)-like permease